MNPPSMFWLSPPGFPSESSECTVPRGRVQEVILGRELTQEDLGVGQSNFAGLTHYLSPFRAALAGLIWGFLLVYNYNNYIICNV